MPRPVTPWRTRFDRQVRKEGGHWIWTGAVVNNNTRPIMYYKGRTVSVRRAVYEELLEGEVLDGDRFTHICEEQLCVHPDHIDLKF